MTKTKFFLIIIFIFSIIFWLYLYQNKDNFNSSFNNYLNKDKLIERKNEISSWIEQTISEENISDIELSEDNTEIIAYSTTWWNTKNSSFSSAKKVLEKTVYGNNNLLKKETFYCGCTFEANKKVQSKNCSFKPANKKANNRDKNIEWEHVVPISWYSEFFPEWYNNKEYKECKVKKLSWRACAERLNKEFGFIQADLYNLQPAIGSVNLERSNKPFGYIPWEKYNFGTCNFESNKHIVEVREEIMWDVARTILYMEEAYPQYNISKNYNKEQLLRWDKEDPVSAEECKRYNIIKKIQGNENNILKTRCTK